MNNRNVKNDNDSKLESAKSKGKTKKKKSKKSPKFVTIPKQYVCPITKKLINDPVVAADGYSYEKAAINLWFETNHNNSPIDNSRLKNLDLNPNQNLKQTIQEFRSKLPKTLQKEHSRPIDLQAAVLDREIALLAEIGESKKVEKKEIKEGKEPKVDANAPSAEPSGTEMQNQIKEMQLQIQALKQQLSPASEAMVSMSSLSYASAAAEPASEAKLALPIIPVSNSIKNRFLDHAMRHNAAIALIYKYFDPSENTTNPLLSECIRHYALLYHMFRHLVALKMYSMPQGQDIKDEDTIVDLRNMIRHGGWQARRNDVLATAKMFAEKNRVADIYHKNQYHQILMTELKEEQLEEMADAFEMKEVKKDPLTSRLDLTKTPLYAALGNYFNELKEADGLEVEAKDLATKQFIVMINAIVSNIPKIQVEGGKILEKVRESYALHFDALKMLVSMCAELRGYLAGKNKNRQKTKLEQFISYCARQLGGKIGHVFPDFDYIHHKDIEELMKVGELALAVNRQSDIATTEFGKTIPNEEKKVAALDRRVLAPEGRSASSASVLSSQSMFAASASISTASALSSSISVSVAASSASSVALQIEGSVAQPGYKEEKVSRYEKEEDLEPGSIWESKCQKEFSPRVLNAALAAVQTAADLAASDKNMQWENTYKVASALKSKPDIKIGEIFSAFCNASETKQIMTHYGQLFQGEEKIMSKFQFLKNEIQPVNLLLLSNILGNKNCNIIYLDLSRSSIKAPSMRVLAKLLPNTRITGLNLKNNEIKDEGLGYIAEVLPRTSILYLNLEANIISAEGIKVLAKVLCIAKLLSLNLGSNKIKNDGVEELAEVLPKTRITRLSLWNVGMGSMGVKALVKILPQTELTKLNLVANSIGKTGPGYLAKATATMRTNGKEIVISADNLNDQAPEAKGTASCLSSVGFFATSASISAQSSSSLAEAENRTSILRQ